MKKMKKYADGGTVKRSFFDEINDLGNVGRLSSMGRGMSRAEAAEETGRSQARAAMGRAAARGEPEIAEDTSRETAREIARETRMAVPGMGAEAGPARAPSRSVTRASLPPRRRAARPALPEPMGMQPRGMTPEERAQGYGGGMSEEDIVRASRATAAPFTRIPRGRESNTMRTLRRAVHGEERAREMEARGYAKGGPIPTKKMAGGGTCRGMGKATRGSDYKFR